jgi:hypothetical protein
MHNISFVTPDELCTFVNTNGIVNTDIAEIFWKEGRWYLFYYV